MRNPLRSPRLSLFAAVSLFLLLALQGCKHRGEGPMERGGRSVDRAGEKVGNVFRK